MACHAHPRQYDHILATNAELLRGRKHVAIDPKYRMPNNKDWLYDKVLGLGIPHIASVVRGQRLRLLQRLMAESASASPPAWATLALEQFAHCTHTIHSDTRPLDFVWYSPQHSSAWLNLAELHPMWLDVWKSWSRVPMKSKLPIGPDFPTTLHMPIWLTTYRESCRKAQSRPHHS